MARLDQESLASVSPSQFKILLAPVKLPNVSQEQAQNSRSSNSAHWDVPLDSADVQQLLESWRSDLRSFFAKDSGLLKFDEEPRSDLQSLCWLAENQGAQLLATVELKSNRLSYKGLDSLGYTFDWTCLILFTPFHIWVGDEIFSLERQAHLRVWDVRNPGEILYEFKDWKASIEVPLNELQHGYVLLNPVRRLWSGPERFGQKNWIKVRDLLQIQVEYQMRKKLRLWLSTEFQTFVETPLIRKRLARGGKGRTYALFVGKNRGLSRYAEDDARSMSRLFLGSKASRALVLESYAKQLMGVEATKANVLAALKRFADTARENDQVVFYFSGQGWQSEGKSGVKQYLLLNNSYLSLADLAKACQELKAEKIGFILDTSFGDPSRGQTVRGGSAGGRSSPKSKPQLSQAEQHLKPLTAKSGWQVLAAADHDGVTGEYEKRGMFTGLIMECLQRDDNEVTLHSLEIELRESFGRLSRTWLGQRQSVIHLPKARRLSFKLRTPVDELTQVEDGSSKTDKPL